MIQAEQNEELKRLNCHELSEVDDMINAAIAEERERILALIDDRIQGFKTYKPYAAWEDIADEFKQFKSIITDGE